MKRSYFLYLLSLIFGFAVVIGAYVNRYVLSKSGLSLFAKRPFISVLVTSYNYEKYIRQTLDSILAQRYKNYEVIIVDDGSTDNSVNVIKEYVNKYKNFHLYQHEGGINKGLPASFKLGVEKAKGEYISVLESDDYWTPNNLLIKVKMINKHPDAVIISNNVIPFGDDFTEVSFAKPYVTYINHTLNEKNDILFSEALFNHIPTFSAVTIKSSILKKLDFNTPIPAFLDLYLYQQIFAQYPLYYISQSLTYWRRHAISYNATLNQANNYAKTKDFIIKIKEVLAKQKDI